MTSEIQTKRVEVYFSFLGCETFFDGLVCWPSTDAGSEATVDCFTIEAFAKAIKYTLTEESETEEGKSCNGLEINI